MSEFLRDKSKALGNMWRVFFDRKKGKDIDINDFPFLFTMQVHNGLSGMIFAGVWFAILGISYPEYWNTGTKVAALLIEVGFAIMIFASVTVLTKIVYDRKSDLRSAAEWDYFARKWMAVLLLWFAIVCSALIWITGGKSSPFIPFYVMVFILALTKCNLPHPGKSLLELYAAAFILAGLAATPLLLPVDPLVIAAIKSGPEKEWADFLFALASMVVPYWSARYAEGREAARTGPPSSDPSGSVKEDLAPKPTIVSDHSIGV
jgi:membrane protein YqaA with SNARE-associated domain